MWDRVFPKLPMLAPRLRTRDTDLLRQMMSAGEVGGCWNCAAVALDLVEALDVLVMASFPGASSCASPSLPVSAGFFCLFFFLVMLKRIQGEQLLAGL